MKRLIVFLIATGAFAQTPTPTTIVGPIYTSTGGLYTGSFSVQSQAKTNTGYAITGTVTTVFVQAGVIGNLALIPNDTSTPNLTSYLVTFANQDKWICVVPTSSAPIPFTQACSPTVPAPNQAQAFSISQIIPSQNNGACATTTAGIAQWTNCIRVSGLPLVLTLSGTVLGINQATTAQAGYLSAADWNTFNNKQTATMPGVTSNLLYNNGGVLTAATGITTDGSALHIGTQLIIGITPTNPYGVTPMLSASGPVVMGNSANCAGVLCYPTPGRVLTVSGLANAGIMDQYALGIDLHPILTATANNQNLVGLWVDPAGPGGQSQFNCGSYTGCRTAGIHSVQPLEQMTYAFFQGDFVGLEDGGLAAGFRLASPSHVIGVGDVYGLSSETFDIGNSTPASSLVGLEVLPTIKNTAAGTATRAADYAADFRVSSTSAVANTLTNQVGQHIQNGLADGNTTIQNKYGLLIEAISGGTVSNWGMYSKSPSYTTGLTNVGAGYLTGAVFINNTDWNGSSIGSALRITLGAASGNTYSIAQSVQNGNSSLGPLAINPYGGAVMIASTTDTGSGAPLQISGPGLQLVGGTQPGCDATHRGEISLVGATHTASVKDSLTVCLADATNTYAWRTIY